MHTRIVKPNQASIVHVKKAQLIRALASDEAHLPCVQNRPKQFFFNSPCIGPKPVLANDHFSSENDVEQG
jgi:hypothetical protein